MCAHIWLVFKTPDKKRILKKKKKNQELLHYALYENIVNKWCLFQKSDFQVCLTFGTRSNFGGNGFRTFDARNLYSTFSFCFLK